MMGSNDDQDDSDIAIDTEQRFHNLRGRLTSIVSAVDRIREAPVTDEQATELQRIEATARELADALTNMGQLLTATLRLAPATRLIWQVACRHGTQVDLPALAAKIAEMRAYYLMHAFTSAVLVADGALLPALRQQFGALGFHHVRVGTRPTDIPYLLDAENADLIVMAPPADAETTWWQTLKILMQGYRHQPVLLQLGLAAGIA